MKAACALCLLLSAAGFLMASAEAAPKHESRITCTNPASGAQWQIDIDYDKNTVDSFAARISQTEISWRDTREGGNYTLDRRSGVLTVVAPSSTGGYFLHHRCKL